MQMKTSVEHHPPQWEQLLSGSPETANADEDQEEQQPSHKAAGHGCWSSHYRKQYQDFPKTKDGTAISDPAILPLNIYPKEGKYL